MIAITTRSSMSVKAAERLHRKFDFGVSVMTSVGALRLGLSTRSPHRRSFPSMGDRPLLPSHDDPENHGTGSPSPDDPDRNRHPIAIQLAPVWTPPAGRALTHKT